MRMLRAIGFAVSYPVTRLGGLLLLRLADTLKDRSRRHDDEARE